jgi:hypothetical protein
MVSAYTAQNELDSFDVSHELALRSRYKLFLRNFSDTELEEFKTNIDDFMRMRKTCRHDRNTEVRHDKTYFERPWDPQYDTGAVHCGDCGAFLRRF